MSAEGSLPRRRITRWLRFRLTLSFAIVFAFLLAGIGFIFRGILNSIQTRQMIEVLDEEWAALRGYVDFEAAPGGLFTASWTYSRDNPDEELFVGRLRRVLMIADAEGRVIESSEMFRSLGVETPSEIRAAVQQGVTSINMRKALDGTPFMVRTGVVIDEKRPFYVALGRSLSQQQALLNRFTFLYFALMPVLLLGASAVGWLVSKRALQPVSDLAIQTEAISGSNLNLRIASRGAGDEIDHLIENFNSMVARLEKAFNQTRQFSTDVSHELRTPLTVIRGHLEVALMTASTEGQYRDAIATALSDVERLSGTVRALLHLSQAESGQMVLQKTTFDFAEAAREAGEQFRPLAESAGISIRYQGPHSCLLRADRVQIERLLSNLLSNAVKYTRPGGAIEIRVNVLGDSAELSVRDTGIGIPADALPHIFERFYRARNQKEVEEAGYGLGLSFVAWIVQAHGGRIDVESQEGEGSEFRVVLPGVAPPKSSKSDKDKHGVSSQRTGA
jgi:heavy metal sensor kinase